MGSVRTGFFCVAFLGFFDSRLGTDPFGIVRLANCVLDLGCMGLVYGSEGEVARGMRGQALGLAAEYIYRRNGFDRIVAAIRFIGWGTT